MEIALARSAPLADPDLTLVQRMAAGDEDALRALYTAYGRRLFAYALRLTGDTAVAEEVLQDSLLAAWQGARRFRGEARVITWLLGIVHHQALNATRRRRLPGTTLEEAAALPDQCASPQAQAEARDRRSALSAAMASLSADHRAALELVFYHGLSLGEVAQVCRCPVGTVKSRLSYARAHVRQALERAGLHAEDAL